MRTALTLLLLVASPACLAQKWVDENGKVYYGTPPAGIHVKRVPMTGGTSSSVGSQSTPTPPPPRYVPEGAWREEERNREYERRRSEAERRAAEQHARDMAERDAGIELRNEERAAGINAPRQRLRGVP